MYEKTYTKKELVDKFGICKNTVYDTIKACGLDTSKTRYTEEEIQTRFAPARALLESKQATFDTLHEHFSMRSAQATPEPEHPRAPRHPSTQQTSAASPVETGQFLEAVQQEIEQSFEVMVEAAVFDVIQRLPQIAMRAANSARSRAELTRVFAEARQEFINSPPSFQRTEAKGALQGIFPADVDERQGSDALVNWHDEEDDDDGTVADEDRDESSETDGDFDTLD